MGSPPHMRGTELVPSASVIVHGITPAHAGNRPSGSVRIKVYEDHPRTCGEQEELSEYTHYQLGSPPHMRGTVCLPVVGEGTGRITPAHAGNSNTERNTCSLDEDHPRTCGEQLASSLVFTGLKGSPPHMRGTAMPFGSGVLKIRITPAHAGNRSVAVSWARLMWDHPRTCGEQLLQTPVQNLEAGSPPHMRGTVTSFENLPCAARITPAHAGNRKRFFAAMPRPKDHPRTCGEQSFGDTDGSRKLGSPPHMRGTGDRVQKS